MDFVHVLHGRESATGRPTPVWPAVTFWVALGVASLAIGFGASLSTRMLLVAPLTLTLFGVLRATQRWRETASCRREADSWIATGSIVPKRYAWRIDELTCERERRLLARSIRGVVMELSPGRLPGASPLNRIALRPHRELLTALATRLALLDRPVSARGVLDVQHLLTDPWSVLYTREDAAVAASLRRVLASLEIR